MGKPTCLSSLLSQGRHPLDLDVTVTESKHPPSAVWALPSHTLGLLLQPCFELPERSLRVSEQYGAKDLRPLSRSKCPKCCKLFSSKAGTAKPGIFTDLGLEDCGDGGF